LTVVMRIEYDPSGATGARKRDVTWVSSGCVKRRPSSDQRHTSGDALPITTLH